MTSALWVALTLQQMAALGHLATAPPVERETWLMGTRLHVVVEAADERRGAALAEASVREVERIEGLLSTWDPDTPLSRVNRTPPGTWAELPGELAEILGEAAEWATRTGHAFEPGMGALVDTWDLRGPGRTPDAERLATALSATGPRGVELSANRMRRLHDSAWIDAGGFGKGAALRAVQRVLEAEAKGPRTTGTLVDLGGQLLALAGADEAWHIDVAHPFDRSVGVATLSVRDHSVATSGTSERGRHILDPRSGRPAEAWGSVTVVHPDPLAADILSTALYVMGPDRGRAWADREGIAALFLESDGSDVASTWTDGLLPFIERHP